MKVDKKQVGLIVAGIAIGIGLTISAFYVTSDSTGKEKNFGLSNLAFCSKEPMGYMNYTKQPDNTYSPGDRLWAYFNLNNQKYNLHSDGSFEVRLESNMNVIKPEGGSMSFSFTLRENYPAHRNPENMYLTHYLTLPENLPLGQYTLEVIVSDELSGENDSISGTFTLVEGESEDKISLDPWDGLLRKEDLSSDYTEAPQSQWRAQDNTWFGIPFENGASRYWVHSTQDRTIGVTGFVCPNESNSRAMFSELSEYWKNYMENRGYGVSTPNLPSYGEETDSIQLTSGGENISAYIVTFRVNNVAVTVTTVGFSKSETDNYCSLVEQRIKNH